MTAIAFFLIGVSFVFHLFNETRPIRNKFISKIIDSLLVAGLLLFVIDAAVWLWKVAP